MEVLYAPPRTAAQEAAFAEATMVFRDLDVTAVAHSQVSDVVSQAQDRLSAAGFGERS